MPLKDVVVQIDVAQPAPRVGLGTPLILAVKTGASTYQEYASLALLAADFANTTEAYKKAQAIFAQQDRPEKVAVATYEAGAIDEALDAFYNRGWHFALVANDLSADQVDAATYIAGKDFKFLAAQVSDNTEREALASKARTLIFDHDVAGEHLDAAAVGALGSLEVGSITWKFKGGFAGITGRYLQEDELTLIEEDNAMAYVFKAGKAQLSDGIDATGEFIDALHGQDFVKVDMENEVQNALQNAPKVPYDARGISLIEASATTTLQRAFGQGIIAQRADGQPDYTIQALTREQSSVQDRANRIYKGLSFQFSLAGAIHRVDPINGEILV